MNKQIIHQNGFAVAVIHSDEPMITDTQSALDLIAEIDYHDGCQRLALNKEAIVEAFFQLSTGLAGELLQKFTNYSMKIAVIGDFSGYTSKALRDFIYECNRGRAVYFVPDDETAIEKLTGV